VPVGVIAILALAFSIPNGFPRHNIAEPSQPILLENKFSKKNFKRIDVLGTFLLLAASILMVTAFEEAAHGRAWDSALVISFLVVSVVLWVIFALWERRITLSGSFQEPVFPWRFLQSRVRIGMIL
jgi:hypothetical protein